VVLRYLYKFLFRKKHYEKFDFSKIKKVLVLRHDRLGDLLVSWPFIKLFHQHFPNIEVHLLLSEVNHDLLKYEKAFKVHVVPYEYDKKYYQRVLSELKAEQFDLIIDPFYSRWTRMLKLIRAIDPKFVIGLEKEAKYGLTGKDLPLYELTTPVDNASTLSDAFRRLYIEITQNPLMLEQYYQFGSLQTKEIQQKVNQFIQNLNYPRNLLLFNVSGYGDYKCMSQPAVYFIANEIARHYSSSVVITGMPSHIEQLKKSIPDFEQDVRFIYDETSILDVYALSKVSKAVLTVDTSVVHLAELNQKPTFALYVKEKMVDELFLPALSSTEVSYVSPLNGWQKSEAEHLLQVAKPFLSQHLGSVNVN